MTREEVKWFASLGDLATLHAQMLGTLQQPTMETASLLNHHGVGLSTLLQCHAKSTGGDKADNDSSSSSSSSDSNNSDSSDSDDEKP